MLLTHDPIIEVVVGEMATTLPFVGRSQRPEMVVPLVLILRRLRRDAWSQRGERFPDDRHDD